MRPTSDCEAEYQPTEFPGDDMDERPLSKNFTTVLGRRMAYFEAGKGRPVVFLHGNPTSSYLWRNVVAELGDCGRLIAPDLIGMGESEKLPGPGPQTYSFEVHKAHLWALFDGLIGADEKVLFVIHDWGSALGFDWCHHHPGRVRGIVYMEAIASPFADWSEWSPASAPLFQGFRSDKGEEMILDNNLFVERILFGTNLRELSENEKAEYRKPFLSREDRWPTLSWPRQLPIGGEPKAIVDMVATYSQWMSENEIPKLFINADPGAILRGRIRDFCRTWKNQSEVTVQGRHFIQEDSGPEIGRHIREWMTTRGLV